MYAPGSWVDELSPRVRELMLRRMTRLDLAAGSIVRKTGDISRNICLVDSGYIRLLGLNPDGRQVLILLYGPGNCFGESPVVANRPSNHTTITLTDIRLHMLAAKDFWELYNEHREIADALCRKFANAVSRQFATREFRATYRLSQQVASTFSTLGAECGISNGNGSIKIDLPLTQADFAEHLEVTRQAVQREIGAMKQAGIVSQSSGAWRIDDPDRLRAMTGMTQA